MRNFRNFKFFEVPFTENLNVIYGSNGSGKSSLLEAIHCLALTKSFRTVRDRDMILNEESFLQLTGIFNERDNQPWQIRFNLNREGEKKIFLNGNPLPRALDLIGKFPVVVLSPEDSVLTFGGPAEKRRLTDRILSQSDQHYLHTLVEYRRLLRERKALLERYDQKKKEYDLFMETFDEKFSTLAETITIKRSEFFIEFSPLFERYHQKLTTGTSTVRIIYSPSFQDKRSFLNNLKEKFPAERNLHYTLSGPHLDKILIIFKGKDVRGMGSQGEHKLIQVALKLAEGAYLEQKLNKTPLYLFDDLFAKLDVQHALNIVRELSARGQIFITTTDLNDLRKHDIEIEAENVNLLELRKSE